MCDAELGAEIEKQLPELRERLKNQFPFFGDDMVRTGAIGEWAAPFAAPSNINGYAVWYESQRLVAKARWRNENAQAGSPTSSRSLHAAPPRALHDPRGARRERRAWLAVHRAGASAIASEFRRRTRRLRR